MVKGKSQVRAFLDIRGPLLYFQGLVKQYSLRENKKSRGINPRLPLFCLATSYSHRGKPPTTIGAKELNFRVRYGNGCDLFAIITRLAHGCAGFCVATWMLRS